MKKINKQKVLLSFFILLFLSMIVLSTIKILAYLNDNKQNRKLQKITSEAITIVPGNELNEIYKIDFNKLKEQNSDTVAYIRVNGTNIDYVVVKSGDNDYYLEHNFNKVSNVSGWIFADYRNKFDGSDKNIIIYGHNTWDGSMFGSLKNVFDEAWYQNEKNHKITFITEDEVAYYKVFSTYVIGSEEYYITTKFNDDLEFDNFVKTLKFRSLYNYDVDVGAYDKIITLSTCSGDGKKRVVLHAKKI